MTLTQTPSLHADVPVPPPPRGDGDGDATAPSPLLASARAVSGGQASPRPPGAGAAASGVATDALADPDAGLDHSAGGADAPRGLASVLDLEHNALEPAAFTRPQTSRPPRPRPVQPPTSTDEAALRRQRLWVGAVTTGVGAASAAVIASWFL
ncbi:MAG: hypothetical protein BRC32_05505 [Actinobacteria bacterium QS_8_72_14]|nr:MAG: hypothetical protein BRC32_05505 [Actinobacteria bacterium QS_8_72_14]